jgi:flagellar biogenesis protein FliO
MLLLWGIYRSFSGMVTFLCLIGRVHFVFEKQASQLAMVNVIAISDSVSVHSNTVIVVLERVCTRSDLPL